MTTEQEKITNRRKYELGFILKEEDLTSVKAVIDKYNPTEIIEGPLVKVNLSYPIKKQNQAFFGYYVFDLEPEKIIELDYDLKNVPLILRYLLVKVPSFIKKDEKKQKKTLLSNKPIRKKGESKIKMSTLTNEALEKLKEEILQ